MSEAKFFLDEKIMKVAKDKEFAIFFDFDGTLMESHIADFNKVNINPIRYLLLREIANSYSLVGFITGRSKDYFENFGIDLFIAGNFGLELEDSSFLEKNTSVMKKIKEFLLTNFNNEISLIDDKKFSLAVHFLDPLGSMEKIRSAVVSNFGKEVNFMDGYEVLEIIPPVSIDKGKTIAKIIKENNIRKILYVGDDFPDIPAFEKINELKDQNVLNDGVSICIYNEKMDVVKNTVDFFLKNVDELYFLLVLLRWC